MVLDRVAVTGVGIVSALGQSADETFERLVAGERGFSPLTLFDAGEARCRFAAEVRGLDTGLRALKGVDADGSRTDVMAFVAARAALAQSRAEPRGLGVSFGGTTGCMFEAEQEFLAEPPERLDPRRAGRLLAQPLSTTAARLARAFADVGPVATVCAACSSGALAIVRARHWVEQGVVPRALAGGADGLCRLTFFGFEALGALDVEPCRPFDRTRRGLSLGEAAAFVVLERESVALARGAKILAFLTGAASGAEAHHITHPEPSGKRASELMQRALRSAGLEPSSLDYVNAHGTGTIQNDAMETKALRLALGSEATRVHLSSSKGQLGHTLGAAGALEAALTVLAIERDLVPPTAGLSDPEDPDLAHVFGRGRKAELRAALSCSFGFGGTGAVLVLENPQARPRTVAAGARCVVVTGIATVGRGVVSTGERVLSLLEAKAETVVSMPSASREPLASLDPARSRRFDGAAALTTLAVEHALADARLAPEGVGLVVGTAFGSVERSVRFVERAARGGVRAASPAEFPHLVLSASSGNASIYLGLTGPVLAVCERSASAESALAAAVALLGSLQAEAIVAGGAESFDPVVSTILGSFEDSSGAVPRSEGAAFLVLEAEPVARARGARVCAIMEGPFAVLAGSALPAELEPPPDTKRALVVCAALDATHEATLESSVWARCPRRTLLGAVGYHEALGGMALAVAAAAVLAGRAESALAVGANGDTLWLTRLSRAASPVAERH